MKYNHLGVADFSSTDVTYHVIISPKSFLCVHPVGSVEEFIFRLLKLWKIYDLVIVFMVSA